MAQSLDTPSSSVELPLEILDKFHDKYHDKVVLSMRRTHISVPSSIHVDGCMLVPTFKVCIQTDHHIVDETEISYASNVAKDLYLLIELYTLLGGKLE